jgi:hypothetical protein
MERILRKSPGIQWYTSSQINVKPLEYMPM